MGCVIGVNQAKILMMKSQTFYLLLLSASLFWGGCNCPPNEKQGDLALSSEAAAFLSYSGVETLVFVDEAGGTMSFTAPRGAVFASDQLCYKTICTEARFGSPSSCDYYSAESRRYTYFNADNTEVLDVLVYSDVYKYGNPNFYDALQVGYASLSARHLIANRSSEPILPGELMLGATFEQRATLELNGRAFTDVLAYEEGALGVYVKPGEGVIGFKDAAHTWVIQ